MPPKSRHDLTPAASTAVLRGDGIKSGLIGSLQGLKCDSRPDITHHDTLKQSPASRQDPGNRQTKTQLCFLLLFPLAMASG